MTRKPDEIKKGLNDPIHVHYHHGDREPHMTPLAMIDLEQLHADALVLIQQLQVENAQLNRCIENMTDKLNAMNDEVAKLQAERDAAVKDMTKIVQECAIASDCNPMHKDLHGYIQQLESDKQQLEGLLTHMNQLRDAAAGRALKMEERVHQLEAERDAAVRDLTEMAQDTDESCEYCKMFKMPYCSLQCRMKNKGFEWRGVTKEE